MIHLQVQLSDGEGEHFPGTISTDRAESVIHVVDEMEVEEE